MFTAVGAWTVRRHPFPGEGKYKEKSTWRERERARFSDYLRSQLPPDWLPLREEASPSSQTCSQATDLGMGREAHSGRRRTEGLNADALEAQDARRPKALRGARKKCFFQCHGLGTS